MTFSERMRRLSTREDLDDLMEELLHKGSSKWTLNSAKWFVPMARWDELSEYFDAEGRLTVDAGEGPPYQRVEILAFILDFHERLETARSGALTASITGVGPESDGGDIHRDAVEDQAPSSVATPPDLNGGEPPADAQRECIICLELKSAREFVDYRGREMCADCRRRLQ